MSFRTLPTEIKDLIVRCVDPGKDLASLSATCSHLHKLVEPYLYTTFTTTGRHAIPLFLRTLSLKPHLARHVRHCRANVPLKQDLQPDEYQLASESIENDEDMQVWIRAQLSNDLYGDDTCNVWFSEISNLYNWDALFAVLLIQLAENLETMRIENYVADVDFPLVNGVLEVMCMAQTTSISTKSLSRLSSVTLIFDSDSIEETIEPTIPWLQLPSVTAFCAINSIQDFNHAGSSMPNHIHTSSLSLSCRYISQIAQQQYLENFNALHNYHYHLEFSSSIYRSSIHDPTCGLENSAHCLQRLILSVEYPPETHTAALGDFFNHPSLANLTALKYLDINIYIALSRMASEELYYKLDTISPLSPGRTITTGHIFHQMPPNLKHLVVRDCNRTIFAHLRTLFDSGLLPSSMKTINLVCDDPGKLVDKENTNWEDLALQHGVRLMRTRECQMLVI